MKWFVTKCCLFLLFIFSFLIIAIGVAEQFSPKEFKRNIKYRFGSNGHMSTRIKDLNTFKEVDILVIGSSHAYRGFDPRIYHQHNLKIFVLGSSAQTPIQTEILVKRYLTRLSPKLVIFEVFPGVFCNDGVESALDLISNDKIDFSTFVMVAKVNNVIAFNTLLFRLYKDLFIRMSSKEPICKKEECYIKGGFVEKKETSIYKEDKPFAKNRWDILPAQKAAFERIIKYIKGQNRRLVLIQTPVYQPSFSSFDNNRTIDDYYHSFGLPYFNFNYLPIWKFGFYFYDEHHLNNNGVKEFNQLMLNILHSHPDWIRP